MSNALAIAAVTAVLRDLLNDGLIDHDLSSAVGNVTVSSLPPDRITTGSSEESRLNLFLYHVSPNPGWRNAELPAYDAQGRRAANPPLALDLHYLLTAYGASEFHQEILLGYGMQLLHETPVLTRDAIRRALAPTSPVGAGPLPTALQALSAADLADQVERVKLSPASLNTEEMSRMWTAFQARYRPTAAYQASVVLIQAQRPTRLSFPVRERRLHVVTLQQPVIDRVTAEGGEREPILAGSRITLRGQRLRGESTLVRTGGEDVTPAAADLSPESITIALPASLRAGVQGAQVVHQVMLGDPPVPHGGTASNVAAFVLRPTLVSIATTGESTDPAGRVSGSLEVEVSPPAGRAQRVIVFLNETGAPGTRAPFGYSFAAPGRNAPADPEETAELTIPFSAVEPATYLARVQVDGAESPLEVDADDASPTFNQYVGPTVEIGA
jgi:Pvc16 N-terminal domain